MVSRKLRSDFQHVIFRDADNPMPPVAVRRLDVPAFPASISLSTANIMIQGRDISTIKNVELAARVSPAGKALNEVGAMYGVTKARVNEDGTFSGTVVVDKETY